MSTRLEDNITWIKSVICDKLNKKSVFTNLPIEEIVKNDIGYSIGFNNINWEQFDWTYEVGPLFNSYSVEDIEIHFNNLYTFVLLSGRICVPYCDWIYENEFICGNVRYYRHFMTMKNEFQYGTEILDKELLDNQAKHFPERIYKKDPFYDRSFARSSNGVEPPIQSAYVRKAKKGPAQ